MLELYRFWLYSIGLACTLSVYACTLLVWVVLYRFGLYSIALCLYSIGLGCTLSVWPVLYRFGLFSIALCLYSIGFVFFKDTSPTHNHSSSHSISFTYA